MCGCLALGFAGGVGWARGVHVLCVCERVAAGGIRQTEADRDRPRQTAGKKAKQADRNEEASKMKRRQEGKKQQNSERERNIKEETKE